MYKRLNAGGRLGEAAAAIKLPPISSSSQRCGHAGRHLNTYQGGVCG